MELKLKNVGIIKDSTIVLNGLTVITGKNNSGKSTVGKALFAVIDAVEQIEVKALNDRIFYAKSMIERAINVLELRYLRNLKFHYRDKSEEIPKLLLEQISSGFFPPIETIVDAVELINTVIKEISETPFESIDKLMNEENKLYLQQNIINQSYRNIKRKRSEAIYILRELIDVLGSDVDLVEYSNAAIFRTLSSEFDNQIHPIKAKMQKDTLILLQNNGEIYFDIEIENNAINDGSHSFISSPFQNSFFIDNAFVIDEILPNSNLGVNIRWKNKYESINDLDYQMLINSRRILSHNEKLKVVLSTELNKSIIEENAIKSKTSKIMDIVNGVLPGSFKIVDNRYVYNYSDTNLNVQNLATGAKMFATIKLLIEKDLINSKTMLILDEPEIHLHPEWQNIFAEILVLLVKEVGINILLTTHSPNFLLAIDVYTKKYGMANKTNYYLAQIKENEYGCEIINVSENLEVAFAYLVAPYLDLDVLRLELEQQT